MQIIIPMSGFGERFRDAGYDVPKPLIEIEGRPIIDYVVKMFRGETNFLFICSKEHLETSAFRMEETLRRIAPEATIIGIEPHRLGPVHAVLAAREHLDPASPVLINYCDFACDWDWRRFSKSVTDSGVDGCIPCYRGFHPHTLWSNYYAYVRARGLEAYDIQEKAPFTVSPREEFASSGAYYFASAAMFVDAAEETIARNLNVGGEFYLSLVYKPMFERGRRVTVFEIDHFMQWGTPADLSDYAYWSGAFIAMPGASAPPRHVGAVMMPMAGLGSRFSREGYALSKPLIAVSNRPMAVQALRDLPIADKDVLVVRRDLPGLDRLQRALTEERRAPSVVVLDQMTDGQASTCMEGVGELDQAAPLTIGACDNGMIYDSATFSALMSDPGVDVIVWGAKGYPGARRQPEKYGWIDADPATGGVKRVSVKQPLSDPSSDPIVVGAFTFKRAGDFARAVTRMKERGDRVNGEYYVDTAVNHAIALGLRCRLFLIDYYLCWGSPDDLKTFQYWQECFHGWSEHPYRKECDPDFKRRANADLQEAT